MSAFLNVLVRLGMLKEDLEYSAPSARVRRSSGPSRSFRFMPDGWAASAGGFPAMTGNVAFLMKDVVLFAASLYLVKQDVARVSRCAVQRNRGRATAGVTASQEATS